MTVGEGEWRVLQYRLTRLRLGASASRITAVIPYFPYSKQCKRKKRRGAIAAKRK